MRQEMNNIKNQNGNLNLSTNYFDELKSNPIVVDGIFNAIDISIIHRGLKTVSYKQGHKSKVDQESYDTSFVHYYDNKEIKEMSFYKKVFNYLKEELG